MPLVDIQKKQPVLDFKSKESLEQLVETASQQLYEPPVYDSLKSVQDAIEALQQLPEPQKIIEINEIEQLPLDPAVEFYVPTPKEPSTELKYALLKQWEAGRLLRWRKWHQQQLQILLKEEEKLKRRQVFIDQLKQNHPWMSDSVSTSSRRLRVCSDSVLELKRTVTSCTEEQVAPEQYVPYFEQLKISPLELLVENRHRICVNLYKVIETGRLYPETMSDHRYNRLVRKYDALLDCFLNTIEQ